MEIDFSTAEPPRIGHLLSGKNNQITDVPGVMVGHKTLSEGAVQTGITVIFPHTGDLFNYKVPAAATVFNGFGKSLGLIQLDELGVIESPIALCNTFAVPMVAQAQIRQAIAQHRQIGKEWPTINPIVLECNDGFLNDIQAMVVAEADYKDACAAASAYIEQGAVGAGRGMSAFGLKGGIGTASRQVHLPHDGIDQKLINYTIGCLVLANFGTSRSLQIAGVSLGEQLVAALQDQAVQRSQIISPQVDQGSIIMILATDAPLDARQLKRLSMRAAAGLARTGSFYGHGSGDIALAFSTANLVTQQMSSLQDTRTVLHELCMDYFFEAGSHAVEQAIVNALWFAKTVQGREGHIRLALRDLFKGKVS